ncbi:hypothetical protein ACWDOR_27200 [Streptosporangium canum]
MVVSREPIDSRVAVRAGAVALAAARAGAFIDSRTGGSLPERPAGGVEHG